MKRIILQMLLLLYSIVVHGQDILDFRMCDVFKGKVKSITITSPEMMQSEALFFPDGKIKFMKNASFCIEYEWESNDELKLNIKSSQGSEYIYIYISTNIEKITMSMIWVKVMLKYGSEKMEVLIERKRP